MILRCFQGGLFLKGCDCMAYIVVTLDLCLEMDSSWPIVCGAEIPVGLGWVSTILHSS